ncbi:MAG: ATP-dependent helicase [Candidatus Peregrinibacteria bacterium]|nr:ATP-dependent helicase [Candidatus Peregrinibacteria bacterium]
MKKDLLASLNPEQRKAVEQIYGPVLVIAGPGTGKTHLLTTRISQILNETDTDPENILCLTFTNAAAVEMRNRLQSRIGPAAYKLKISTFHGFCETVMENYPRAFEKRRENREIADDLQKALAFKDTVESKKWNHFGHVFDPFMARTDFFMTVSKLKRENVSPQNLRDMIPEEKKRLEEDPSNFYKRKTGKYQPGDMKPSAQEKIDHKVNKMTELADFWEVYEDKLRSHKAFDFDDQIMWVVDELKKNEGLRADLQEQFQFILVDEYQDTNNAQNEILWALTSFDDSPNLLAVGDDDQSIYRFQGASVENIHEFCRKFPTRLEVSLKQNYRSAQNILDAAFASVAKNLERIDPEKSLTAAGENKNFAGDIFKIEFGSTYAEINFMVHKIKEALSNGTPPNEIAILVRKNAEIKTLAKELPKFGIPVAAQIFQNIFDDEYVRILIAMLEVFNTPTNDEKTFEVLHAPFWNISAEKILQISLDSNQNKKKSKMAFLLEKSAEDPELKNFIDFFANASKNFFHCRPGVLAEKLFYESDFAKFMSEQNLTENFAKIRKFFDFIRDQKCETLSEILEIINLYKQLELPIRPDELPADRRAVNILTAHGSKGREFDLVFIPGFEDRKWGNNRAFGGIPLPVIFHETHDANEDERRLFFVSLTRARKEVYLSYSHTDTAGRDKNPSQFWHEIPEKLTQTLPTDEIEEEVQKLLPIFLSGEKEFLLTEEEKEILGEKVKNFVWSASSLQKYLDCPRKFLFQNLYKFPRRPVPAMALGTALHSSLERFFQKKDFNNLSVLEKEFTHSLTGQNLEQSEFKKLHSHGLEILRNYFENKKNTFTENTELELDLGKNNPVIDNIRITGKVDKVEFLDDKKTTARIIDYKSGKPKHLTKNTPYWRQLVFYDLLARQAKTPWQISDCAIEFLTPASNGKIETKVLKITPEDREKVIEELKTANEAIQNLEFPVLPNPTHNADMEFWQTFGKQ